jgi:hypothetical protein
MSKSVGKKKSAAKSAKITTGVKSKAGPPQATITNSASHVVDPQQKRGPYTYSGLYVGRLPVVGGVVLGPSTTPEEFRQSERDFNDQ